MNKNDQIRLRHMMDAAREALSFADGKTRESLDTDRALVLILLQEITIIGEAASKVSQDGRDESPEILWTAITGMRNRVVHGYFDVNLDLVWNTIANRLPELIAQLEKHLPPHGKENLL